VIGLDYPELWEWEEFDPSRLLELMPLREGRVAFDDHPERLTEDELAKIYAGDPCRTENGENPELLYARHGIEVSIRLTEGRDGVSSH
jgi:hypothetical protein